MKTQGLTSQGTLISSYLGNDIVISEKKHFESVLSYKEAHKEDFQALQNEQEFTAVFFRPSGFEGLCR